jgi:acyl-CoA thioester hydrolase
VTSIKEVPGVRITFHYECFNQKNELLNTGSATLVFVDGVKKKPTLPPDWFMDAFEKRFEE